MINKIQIRLLISLLIPFVNCAVSSAQSNTFPPTGKVGIGTISPTSTLEIVAPAGSNSTPLMKLRMLDSGNDNLQIINATNGPGIFVPTIKGYTSSNAISLYLIGSTDNTSDTGNAALTVFDSRTTAGKVIVRPLFSWTNYGTRYMTMTANGNVGIGIENPVEKLAVNGKIRAQEIKVDSPNNWPDYVFDKNYLLPTLPEVEKFVLKNRHLPEIPSERQILTKGLDIGEMNKLLLKKVEELTLYLIEQNKKITALEKKLNNKL